MSEYLTNLEIPGLLGSDKREYTNPSGQSFTVPYPESGKVILTRPFSQDWTGLTFREELLRRKKAIELHKEFLPEYTLPQEQVVLQGESDGHLIPVLGRMMEGLDSVKPTSEIPLRDILKDAELTKAYKDYSVFALKALFSKGILVDPGSPQGKRKYLVEESIFKNSNLMIGYEPNGERRIIADPDWYKELPLKWGKLRPYAKHSTRLLANTVLYGTADLVHGLRERFHRPSESEIQNIRNAKKRALQELN